MDEQQIKYLLEALSKRQTQLEEENKNLTTRLEKLEAILEQIERNY